MAEEFFAMDGPIIIIDDDEFGLPAFKARKGLPHAAGQAEFNRLGPHFSP